MTQDVELTGDDFFFFFFFGDHPNFRPWFVICTLTSSIKPVTASHRPAFDQKNVGGAIKFVSQCPDFCFSKYGNPNHASYFENSLRKTAESYSREHNSFQKWGLFKTTVGSQIPIRIRSVYTTFKTTTPTSPTTTTPASHSSMPFFSSIEPAFLRCVHSFLPMLPLFLVKARPSLTLTSSTSRFGDLGRWVCFFSLWQRGSTVLASCSFCGAGTILYFLTGQVFPPKPAPFCKLSTAPTTKWAISLLSYTPAGSLLFPWMLGYNGSLVSLGERRGRSAVIFTRAIHCSRSLLTHRFPLRNLYFLVSPLQRTQPICQLI